MEPTRSAPPAAAPVIAWVGVAPPEDAAEGPDVGLWYLRRSSDGTLTADLADAAPAPSFLAVHPDLPVLYAVGEGSPGTVAAYDVDPEAGLTLRHRVGSGGDGPCHLLVVPGVGLLVAHYVSGSVSRVPLADDGGFTAEVLEAGEVAAASVVSFSGEGPRQDRQDGPHAHSTHLAPDGTLLVADLGADRLHGVRPVGDDGLVAEPDADVVLPAGSGPRHVVTVADHLVVVGELDGRLHRVRWTAGRGQVVDSVPAATAPQVSGSEILAAHVSLAEGHVLVTVRGSDVLGVHRVGEGDEAAGGRLTHVADVPVGGSWPRHHAVVDGAVLVAVQEAGRVVSLGPVGEVLSGQRGSGAPQQADVPYAACLVPVPASLRP